MPINKTYIKTDWIDEVTPLDEAHMDNIETGIEEAKIAAEEAKTSANNAQATANQAVSELANKQDKLIAGENIIIENNIISATGSGEMDPEDFAKYIEYGMFKVDGEIKQGEVILEAGKVYEISGYLKDGHIILNSSAEKAKTQLIFRNTYIKSDRPQAIYATQTDGRVAIKICENCKVIVVSGAGEVSEDESFGAIQADGNFIIVTDKNSKLKVSATNEHQHGIRASRLYLQGAGLVEVDAKHDAFHGGKLLRIDSGNYEVLKASVDGFEAKYVQVFGGNVHITRAEEDGISSKDSKGVILSYDVIITYDNVFGNLYDNMDILEVVPFEYDNKVSLVDYFGPAIVKQGPKPVGDFPTEAELANYVDVNLVDNRYVTANVEKQCVYIKGYINNVIEFAGPKTKVYADNVCIDTDKEYSVYYSATKGKLEGKCNEDAILLVINNGEGDAIKSNSSVGLQENGNYIFKTNTGKCINNVNYLFTKGDGIKYFITDGEVTVKAARFTIGADHADIAEDTKTDMFEIGSVKVNNKIVLEPNAVQYCDGKLYYAYGQIGLVESNGFECLDIVRFWKENLDVIEKENSITVVEVKQAGPVIDAYTKEESDARFVSVVDYNNLATIVAAQKSIISKLEDRFAHELYLSYPYITYTAEGLNPIVVRGNDGTIDDPVLTDGNHTVTIDKDTKQYTAGTGVVEKANSAQVNIIVTCHEGKQAYAEGSDSKKYKNVKYDEVYDAELNQYRIQCTQVAGNFDLTITEVDIPQPEPEEETIIH